jgi:DNA-binding transcriptional LysR family regulator
VLNEVEQIKGVARRTIDPESGTVRLGIFPTLGPYLLPHVIPLVRDRFPGWSCCWSRKRRKTVLHMLREGKLDAGILALPLHEDSACIPSSCSRNRSCWPCPTITSAGHSKGKLKLSDLAAERLLLLEDGHCLRDQALEVCQLAGAGEKSGFRATSLETLRQMVAANVGITLLPTLATKPPMARTDNVHLIEFAATRRAGASPWCGARAFAVRKSFWMQRAAVNMMFVGRNDRLLASRQGVVPMRQALFPSTDAKHGGTFAFRNDSESIVQHCAQRYAFRPKGTPLQRH